MKKNYHLLVMLAFSLAILLQPQLSAAQVQQHLKKDGTPDKRYATAPNTASSPAKANSTPAKSSVTSNTKTPPDEHLKADGTSDKRYKSTNSAAAASGQHLKADGTPDKRYETNSAASGAAPVAAAPNPVKVPAAARTQSNTPSSTPVSPALVNGKHLNKDGTPDMRYKENRTSGLDKNGAVDKRYKTTKPE